MTVTTIVDQFRQARGTRPLKAFDAVLKHVLRG